MQLSGNNNNNGNFICVFKCTIVNLATYRQFTNAAWDWIIKKKKTTTKKTATKQQQQQKKQKQKQKQNKTKQKLKKYISKLH